MEYIIILGAFQALLALCLFIASRRRKPADSLLTWMLICIFTHLSIKFIIYAASGSILLKTAFNTFIDLAYGPLLWMYARKVKNDHYRPLQHWYLLLPTFAAAAIYTFITVKLISDPPGAVRWLSLYNEVTKYLILLSTTIFPLLCLQVSAQLPAFWKSEQQLIKKIAACFLLIPALWMITNIINALHALDDQTINTGIRIIAYSNMLVMCLFIIQYRLQAQALNNKASDEKQPAEPSDFPVPVILVEEKESLVLAVQPAGGDVVPRKSALTTLQREAIAVKLAVLMQEKKIYTDPELTLEKLSSLIKTPRHHLSEVLNQYLHQTFYQYINDHRMKEVLHLLDRCRQQEVTPNILSLAYDAGFNSKSSFNQYFKKTTGYTPTEYLKQPRKTESPRLAPNYINLQQSIQPH
ncbi:AraC family transcriptional regulator [Pseudoflavitalea sp. X16]|uniref:helix-turn-helix domain-containing protein n=1 Tax=Paraflavitalea devenefica TaxID=2716334 RepID=UPI0014249B45|nr:helix-turn-helix domain-containing protein [Paraflavitalea devenefica]NII28811.1 AraC family transcriptional regulator [Paraflavitalea devenefica]